MTRNDLYELIKTNLSYNTDTSKLRWIMDANKWKTAEDVRDKATDDQIEAFGIVWGIDAFTN